MTGFPTTAYTAVSAVPAHRGDNGHMWGDGAGWMWVVGPIAMTVWFALLALLVWWIVTLADHRARSADDRPRKDANRPEDVVAMRFARGEISADEYHDTLAHLGRRRGTGD
ncbi:SHOCT domain-containing protein [Yinghuangia soli]|uniref:SHOCT domain-containing protein n=1 Tax=Yinghuangia soli TaxID=2908204 RepID=A0AA41Q9N0_9ACTN|nr:hypothetical protein [Yinghuangia soli]MCF2533827.1 hypothetical protein [Yinghuangia soli]